MASPVESIDRHTLHWSSLIRDLTGGSVVGIVTVCYCLSYAALIFSGPLGQALPAGITLLLIGAGICAIAVAMTSSFTTAIAGPDAPTMAVASVLAGSVAAAAASADPRVMVATVVVGLVAATATTGLALYALGVLHLGRWIRYVPYPVIGGFLAASGWLLASGAIRVATGVPLDLAGLAVLTEPSHLAHFAAAALYAAVLLVALNRWQHFLVLPCLLVAGGIAVYAALGLTGLSLDEARAAGWLLPVPRHTSISFVWTGGTLAAVDWQALTGQAGDIMAIIAVTTIVVLINATGLEVEGRQDADLDRELRSCGLANVLSGAGGGIISNISLNRTRLNAKAGANSRVGGIVAGILAILALFYGIQLAGFIPVPILGGLLLFLGLSLLFTWIVRSRARLSWTDYLLILVIFVVAVRFGYAAGVLVGFVAASVMFAATYSRISVVKHALSGNEFGSTVDRPPDQARALRRYGGRIHVFWLQGYIFFGSAYSLLENIKHRVLSRVDPVRWIVLDFRSVDGIDSSAVYSFLRLRHFCEDNRLSLVFTGLPKSVDDAMRRQYILGDEAVRVFSDLDHALEWCEEALINDIVRAPYQSDPFEEWLAQEMGDRSLVDRFFDFLEPLSLAPGETLFAQGDPPDSMYLIRSGRVSVNLRDTGGRTIRLRSMVGRTVVGEMGYYRNQPRTASVVADVPTEAYRLSITAIRDMEAREPMVAAAFHRLIVRLLADRLSFANSEIAALQR